MEDNANIRKVILRPSPFVGMNRRFFLFYAPLKALFQVCSVRTLMEPLSGLMLTAPVCF